MSEVDTSKTAIFAAFDGDEQRFQLRLGEIAELERKCNAGIGAVMVRLAAHQFYAADVWDTIRLGLIGGGMGRADADARMLNYRTEPLSPYLELAADILSAAVSGPKPDEEKATVEGNQELPATSPPSMQPEAP